MILYKILDIFRPIVYGIIRTFFQGIARLFGYPKTEGLPTSYLNNELFAREQFFNQLPSHQAGVPSSQRAETVFEVIFGSVPKIELISKYFYENTEEGFYNFYVVNYKNLYFLPDWLSEFLQIRCHFFLDTNGLESIREILFVGLIFYCQLMSFRITLSWFVAINPFVFPWCYLSGLVDWAEELFLGVIPTVFGINIFSTVVLTMLGRVADNLNHLVLTMPFLPSEGEEKRILINQQIKDVIVFHYLPALWVRYPIPNKLKTFWCQERLDILEYLETHYVNLSQSNHFRSEYAINFIEKLTEAKDHYAHLKLDHLL